VTKNGRGQKWAWQTLKKMKKYEHFYIFLKYFFKRKTLIN
jgi:hypothetical protein